MRIPHKLTIGGRIIKVKYEEMKDLGYADYENGVISLKKGMTRRATEAAFFHECLHHCNTTLNHAVLDSLAEQMYSMLKNNKII